MTLNEIKNEEVQMVSSVGGWLEVPESFSALHELQREKILAVYHKYGKAFLGNVNHYGEQRKNLTVDTVYEEYTGQAIYNSHACFAVPNADHELARLIVKWNKAYPHDATEILDAIMDRIEKIGGVDLLWS